MSQVVFGPDETVILSGRGDIEQPIKGNGELYLTTKRLLLIHKSGLVRKKETPLVDIRLDQLSYAKVEGLLSKVLVLGVTQSNGIVVTYKIKVPRPDSWLNAIFRAKQAK